MHRIEQGKSEIEFQLVNVNFIEDYAVWDNNKKTFLRPSQNQQLIGTDGKTYPIGQTRFISTLRFQKLFPNASKKNQYLYTALVNGIQDQLPLSHSAHLQLQQAIMTLTERDDDVLQHSFILRKTGTNHETRYYVVIGKKQKGLPQSASPHSTTNPFVKNAFVGIKIVLPLSKEESELLFFAKSATDNLSESEFTLKFVEGMAQNWGVNCPLDRAKWIYTNHYLT